MSRSIFARLHRRFGTQISGVEKHNHIARFDQEIEEFTRHIVDRNEISKIINPETENQPSVIIIGAGFAGLSAAYFLLKHNVKVTLLEARERVGGRVHSLRDFANGQTIEGGAELIGTNHRLWVKLAKEFGFSMSVVTQDELFSGAGLHEPLEIGGIIYDHEGAKRLYELMDLVCEKMVADAKNINAKQPWLSVNAENIDKKSLSEWLDERVAELEIEIPISSDEKKNLRKALDMEFSNNNAVSTEKQSMLGMLALVKGGGGKTYWSMTEVYRCSHGNDALAKEMCDLIIQKNGNQVLTQTPVDEILIGSDRVCVKDQKGKEHNADYLILAVPPSVWGNFKKVSPDVLNEYSCQMGLAIKYLSSVKSRFWIEQGIAPSGLANSIGMTWEGSDNQICKPENEYELTVFAGAKSAQDIVNMSDAKRDLFYKDEMNRIYPGYDEYLINKKFMNWPKEPWTEAGYSFPNTGEVCTKIKKLNEGYNERMFFAGEHTCMAFVGYMEGALQSGANAANKILEKIKK